MDMDISKAKTKAPKLTEAQEIASIKKRIDKMASNGHIKTVIDDNSDEVGVSVQVNVEIERKGKNYNLCFQDSKEPTVGIYLYDENEVLETLLQDMGCEDKFFNDDGNYFEICEHFISKYDMQNLIDNYIEENYSDFVAESVSAEEIAEEEQDRLDDQKQELEEEQREARIEEVATVFPGEELADHLHNAKPASTDEAMKAWAQELRAEYIDSKEAWGSFGYFIDYKLC